MEGYEIRIPGRRFLPVQTNDRPVIRVSADAYNAIVEIGNESTLSIKEIASILILEASKHVVYDRQEV